MPNDDDAAQALRAALLKTITTSSPLSCSKLLTLARAVERMDDPDDLEDVLQDEIHSKATGDAVLTPVEVADLVEANEYVRRRRLIA